MIKYSLIALLLSLLSGVYTVSLAEDSNQESDSGSFFIPKAQRRFSEDQACVEPTEDMRKNHMTYLLHQRDETVHEGIRTKQHSLVECINCHVSDVPDAPRVDSEKHFCNSCHTYAAVNIDCFQCHADRPAKPSHFHSLSNSASHRVKVKTINGEPITLSPEQLQVLTNEGAGNE